MALNTLIRAGIRFSAPTASGFAVQAEIPNLWVPETMYTSCDLLILGHGGSRRNPEHSRSITARRPSSTLQTAVWVQVQRVAARPSVRR